MTDTDTFTFERSFALPPDRIWHLMTDPGMRESWSAPGDAVLVTLSSDLRVGGSDRQRCGPEDAPEFEVETRWYQLDSPSDATFTEVIEAGGMRLGVSLVSYRISPDGPGSKVFVNVAVVSFVGAEMIEEFRAGWTGGIENLDQLVAAKARPA